MSPILRHHHLWLNMEKLLNKQSKEFAQYLLFSGCCLLAEKRWCRVGSYASLQFPGWMDCCSIGVVTRVSSSNAEAPTFLLAKWHHGKQWLACLNLYNTCHHGLDWPWQARLNLGFAARVVGHRAHNLTWDGITSWDGLTLIAMERDRWYDQTLDG